MPPTNHRLTILPDGRLEIRAPAKLNLGLRVHPRRPDGFHDIESWMVPLSWHDTLWITPGGPVQLSIRGRNAGIPGEVEKNLVGKAALKLAAAAGIPTTGQIELHKVLPPGGGLGGGSSDAAGALVALNHAWALAWPDERLAALGAELGSDIPFFIAARPSLCTGRGEIMTPLQAAHRLFAALIIPPQGCPTKEVFQSFDAGHRQAAALPADPTDWTALASSSAEALNETLMNDLAPAAFHIAPWLAVLRDRAEHAAGQKIHLTGSGSTLFTLCRSSVAAEHIRAAIAAALDPDCACICVQIVDNPAD